MLNVIFEKYQLVKFVKLNSSKATRIFNIVHCGLDLLYKVQVLQQYFIETINFITQFPDLEKITIVVQNSPCDSHRIQYLLILMYQKGRARISKYQCTYYYSIHTCSWQMRHEIPPLLLAPFRVLVRMGTRVTQAPATLVFA